MTRFGQTKRADYTEHQKSAGAWLSLQNDVLCNRLLIQSRVLLSTAPANRTKGVVEQFGTSGVPIPCRMNRLIMSQYGRTFLFSCYVAAYRCAIIIQIMRCIVKVAYLSQYIRNYKERKSTVTEKVLFTC